MATGERHSGRLLLRMPPTLHAELAQAAEREGTSLNQLIVGLLSRSVEQPDGVTPSVGPEPQAKVATAGRQSRTLTVALAVNLVVLLVAGAVAVILLVVAWRGGF